MLWEASFSLEGSLRATGGRATSWAPFLVVSASFSASSDYPTSLEEILAIRGTLGGLSLPLSTSKETGSALELEEPKEHMAGGSTHSLLS